jgi:hypothetical protein
MQNPFIVLAALAGSWFAVSVECLAQPQRGARLAGFEDSSTPYPGAGPAVDSSAHGTDPIRQSVPITPRGSAPAPHGPVFPQSPPDSPVPPGAGNPARRWPGLEQRANAPFAAWGFQPPPLRVLNFGWPHVGVMRRDLPWPDAEAHPRQAGLKVLAAGAVRVFVDDLELECSDGAFCWDTPLPMIPGAPESHFVRVETLCESGEVVSRGVFVYLRMGRLTELAFR